MQGTVIRVRPRGVHAQMDSDTSTIQPTDQFQLYRIVNGVEVNLATLTLRRHRNSNELTLNWVGGVPPAGTVLVGDLIRKL